jgi:tripartite-type tricarboxylate transporter receptor subunit TctC
MLTVQPMMIVAKKTMQADTLHDLIAWLRANPDKASQGTAGAGSIGRFDVFEMDELIGMAIAFRHGRACGAPTIVLGDSGGDREC